MPKITDEPSLKDIEDYDSNESRQKRNSIRLVIVFILIIGAILAYFKQGDIDELKEIEQKTQIPQKQTF